MSRAAGPWPSKGQPQHLLRQPLAQLANVARLHHDQYTQDFASAGWSALCTIRYDMSFHVLHQADQSSGVKKKQPLRFGFGSLKTLLLPLRSHGAYMGIRWRLEVDCSLTHSCLSLTTFIFLRVYTFFLGSVCGSDIHTLWTLRSRGDLTAIV